jgi:hypothetical protein
MTDSSQSPPPGKDMAHISGSFYTIDLKYHRKNELNKNTSVKNEK